VRRPCRRSRGGFWWCGPVFVAVSAVTGGAVLRAAGRVTFGWGPSSAEPAPSVLPAEPHPPPRRRVPVAMAAPMVALLPAGLVVGLVPGLAEGTGAPTVIVQGSDDRDGAGRCGRSRTAAARLAVRERRLLERN